MRIVIFFYLLSFLIVGGQIFAQNYNSNSIIVEFVDKADLPIETISGTNKSYSSNITSIANILNNYQIENVYQAFPAASKIKHYKAERLERIYVFQCQNCDVNTLKTNFLSDSTHFNGADLIPIMETDCGVPFTPNDIEGNNAECSSTEYLSLINAQEAWGCTKGDRSVKIGIIDHGFITGLPELTDKVDYYKLSEEMFECNPSESGGEGSDCRHGNYVAGMAAAHTNNNQGTSAIGFNCGLELYAVGYEHPVFENPGEDVEDWTRGYNHLLRAVGRNVKIVNWSWGYCIEGTSEFSQPGSEAIDEEISGNIAGLIAQDIIDIAFEHGTTVIATAGNGTGSGCDGTPGDLPVPASNNNGYRYPASFTNAISVSGTDVTGLCEYLKNDVPTSYSHNDAVDILAPGYKVEGISTSMTSNSSCHDGTSFAAPIVAGVCGLILSANPCLTSIDVRNILTNNANTNIITDIAVNIPYYDIHGTGLVDAYASVQAATNYTSTGWQSYTLTNGENLWEDISVRYVEGDIVVSDGQTLIIRNSTLMMQSGTAIIVEKGGRLFIDNGKITNGCTGQNWEGIIVEGEGLDQPSPDVYLNSSVSNHGVVILENAIIQNAKVGVYGRADSYNPGIGIIHATNTEFLNNDAGILLEFFYRNQYSVIQDCIFDGNGNGIGLMGNGLTTDDVTNNLIIEGNLFKGSGLTGRTVGITVWSSSGDIGSSTNVNSQNTFEDLYKGIDVYSLLNPRMTVNIFNNEFINVEKGITLNTTAFNIVEGNRFLNIPVAPSSNTDDATYGVQALQAFGLDLMENVFEAADNADNTFGLILGETALYCTQVFAI